MTQSGRKESIQGGDEMSVVESSASELRAVKQQAQGLVEFDQEFLRTLLFQAAGDKLTSVSESSSRSIGKQLDMIRHSVEDFDHILERMNLVQSNVSDILSNVTTVVEEVGSSSAEMNRMSSGVGKLQQHISDIDSLVKTVNEIADQTQLLSLNATIEAARAGEAGKGFAVVASEVKELSTTTKKANQEIRDTLERITQAVETLSTGVQQAVQQMEKSLSAVEITRSSAAAIGQEAQQFGQQLQRSRQNFARLDASSVEVENESREITTIGRTFAYLLELIHQQDQYRYGVDPLDRLGPLVQESSFRADQRFRSDESEYHMTADQVLISATDTRGMITFANNEFYEVAEYDPGELVGKPHNVIRHPDMPKTAFADLWQTVQSGKLWQGYVVNRSRTGRAYWVKANVFPCFENGQIVGYISIRTQPDRAAVEQAKQAYRQVP